MAEQVKRIPHKDSFEGMTQILGKVGQSLPVRHFIESRLWHNNKEVEET